MAASPSLEIGVPIVTAQARRDRVPRWVPFFNRIARQLLAAGIPRSTSTTWKRPRGAGPSSSSNP